MKVGDLVKHADGYIGVIMETETGFRWKTQPSHTRYYFSSGEVGFWTNTDRLEVISESR